MRLVDSTKREPTKLRHAEHIRLELTALRLDKIDPQWHDKFMSTAEAAGYYREQLVEMEQRS